MKQTYKLYMREFIVWFVVFLGSWVLLIAEVTNRLRPRGM